ncbi:hypothetical protein EJB05_44222, partial [Eragrostis curvula]
MMDRTANAIAIIASDAMDQLLVRALFALTRSEQGKRGKTWMGARESSVAPRFSRFVLSLSSCGATPCLPSSSGLACVRMDCCFAFVEVAAFFSFCMDLG